MWLFIAGVTANLYLRDALVDDEMPDEGRDTGQLDVGSVRDQLAPVRPARCRRRHPPWSWREDTFVVTGRVKQGKLPGNISLLRAARFISPAEQRLDDVAAMVDTNLFGASLDERIDDDVAVAMARMLIIGEPAAVFVVPVGAEPG